MKTPVRALLLAAFGLTLLMLIVQPAFAYLTLTGTVPAGGTVVILQPHHQQGATGTLKFKFSAPAPRPGGYAFNFCIGPASNPCGGPTAYVVVVPASEERLAVVPASIFADNVLVVSQGTKTPLPFSVEIE
jgi:hypothetical protein